MAEIGQLWMIWLSRISVWWFSPLNLARKRLRGLPTSGDMWSKISVSFIFINYQISVDIYAQEVANVTTDFPLQSLIFDIFEALQND